MMRGAAGYVPANVAITGGSITGITDLAIADGGTAASTAQAAAANLGVWQVLAKSAVAVSGAADTNENVLATITVPANSMGPNGCIRVTYTASNNNSAGTKTWRVRFGGIGGNIYLIAQNTTVVALIQAGTVQNRNLTNSQVGGCGSTNVSYSAVAAPATSAVDTTASTTIVITGQKNTGGDTITLESYVAELSYGA